MRSLTALAFVVDVLAAFRITRLVVRDTFPPIAKLRERVVERSPDGYLAELIECPWCAGFWIAVVVAVARYVIPVQWNPVSFVFALSALTGLISERE